MSDRTPARGPRAPRHAIAEAYEVYGYPGEGPLLISCEHASNRIPDPLPCKESDREMLQTHWGIDIGARQMCMELVERTGSTAVMARFSRLLVDPNRHRDRPDLIKTAVEDVPLTFNQNLDQAQIEARIDRYHEAYHQAVDRALAARVEDTAPLLFLSIHSFTPIWARRLRTMDIGILYAEHESEALALQKTLIAEDFFVALNEPYSAAFGLMYAAERHGEAHKVTHLELEFNQALICTPERVRRIAARVCRAIMNLPRFH